MYPRYCFPRCDFSTARIVASTLCIAMVRNKTSEVLLLTPTQHEDDF